MNMLIKQFILEKTRYLRLFVIVTVLMTIVMVGLNVLIPMQERNTDGYYRVEAKRLADEIEDLEGWRGQLQDIDEGIAVRRNELARLRDAATELTVLAKNEESVDPRLLGMTTQDDRALRDKLEECSAEREKANRAVEDAKQRSDTSRK